MKMKVTAPITNLKPIIKWPGGKEKELRYIIDNLPESYDSFYDPFVGGGSVFMALKASRYFINDLSIELINLYKFIKQQDADFFKLIDGMDSTWQNASSFFERNKHEISSIYVAYREGSCSFAELESIIDLFIIRHRQEILEILFTINEKSEIFVSEIGRTLKDKMRRMYKIEKGKGILSSKDLDDNLKTSVKSAVYMYYRTLYNKRCGDRNLQTALFFFLRNFAYSGMFRFSRSGGFNVPYGGIAYNSKSLKNKLEFYKSEEVKHHFSLTTIFNSDFEEFLKKNPPKCADFIFLDPPYDSEFSTYDNNVFNKSDQERLADYLIHRCKGKWMLIIKYTEFVYNLYANHEGITIQGFNKEYLVSFMNRNDKKVKHLIIKNY